MMLLLLYANPEYVSVSVCVYASANVFQLFNTVRCVIDYLQMKMKFGLKDFGYVHGF